MLLTNDGILPLGGPGRTAPARVAVHRSERGSRRGADGLLLVRQPRARRTTPRSPIGFEIPTVLEALRGRAARRRRAVRPGLRRRGRATARASPRRWSWRRRADVAVVVVGDQAGLFGRGTVGEGNDAETLDLPGVQRELVEAVVATGTPVVMVMLTGRPYAIGWAVEGPAAPAAVLQSFFPGEEGGAALAGVLSGRVNPSGRLSGDDAAVCGCAALLLPAPGPRRAVGGDQRRLAPRCCRSATGCRTPRSSTRAAWSDRDGRGRRDVRPSRSRVTNTGDRAGSDVVQLYAHDVVREREPARRPAARLPACVARSRGRPPWCSSACPPPDWRSPDRCDEPDRRTRRGRAVGRRSSCEDKETTAAIEVLGPRAPCDDRRPAARDERARRRLRGGHGRPAGVLTRST